MVIKRKDYRMIAHMDGDLLEVQKLLNLDVICHQVNCQGVMGSGIAKQLRDTYPEVYRNYLHKCEAFPKDRSLLLGQVQMVGLDNVRLAKNKVPYVCNFFSQFSYGYDGRRYTSYDAFWNCLHNLKASVGRGSTIGFPYNIGCDRGGANWAVIEKMIEEVLGDDYYVYIVHYNGGK
jgi:O-acetyl-ADP-ribose deacetylase (regulator of RNase III)